jgi:hypothetical protein
MAFRRLNSGANTLRSNINKAQDKLNSIELPEKYKGTIIEKWTKYWKQLVTDYKEMFLDTGREMKNKPFKTSVYATLLGGSYYCCKNNPDEQTYFEEIRKYNNDMMLVSEATQNPTSTEYLKFIERCNNQGILRRLTLGVVSFIWLDNYDKNLALYKSTCTYLKPEYLTFHERIIDVGFLNKFWKLTEKMVDYDINEANI